MIRKVIYIGTIIHILFILLYSLEAEKSLFYTSLDIIKFICIIILGGFTTSFIWSKFKYHNISKRNAKWQDNLFGSIALVLTLYIIASLGKYTNFIDKIKLQSEKGIFIQKELQSQTTVNSRFNKSDGPFGIKMGESAFQYRSKLKKSNDICLTGNKNNLDFYNLFQVIPPYPYKVRFTKYFALGDKKGNKIFSIIACQEHKLNKNQDQSLSQACDLKKAEILSDFKIKYDINIQDYKENKFFKVKENVVEINCIEHSSSKNKFYITAKYTDIPSFIRAKKQNDDLKVERAKSSGI